MKSREFDSAGSVKRRKGFGVAAAVLAGTLMAVSVPSVANAVTYSGTRACAGQFGWLTVNNSVNSIDIAPPGTLLSYYYVTPGSRSRVAQYSDGSSKSGGGSWYTGGSQIDSYSPYCSSVG